MADTYTDLRDEVLDWVTISPSVTKYDDVIRRAVNNVTNRLNRGPILLELAQRVSLAYNLPENYDSTLTSNPDLSWYGPTESWTPTSQTEWPLTEQTALRQAQNPVLVNGEPYASQTGEALNAGSRLEYLFRFDQGDEITGTYYSQTIEVLPGREYTAQGDIVYDDNLLNQDKFDPMVGWACMSVVAPGGEALEIISQKDVLMPYTAQAISPYPLSPEIVFKVWQAPGKGADDPVSVEVRIGFNTDGLVKDIESAIPPPGGPAYWATSPEFEVNSANVFLTGPLDTDNLVTSATLPDDCRNVVSIKLGGRNVPSIDQHMDDPRFRAHFYYKRDGLEILFSGALDPVGLPPGVLRYIPEIPAIDDTNQETDHLGIAKYRRAYLYGALSDVCYVLRDWEARAEAVQMYDAAFADIISDRKRRQYQSSNRPRVRRA